MKRFVCPLGHTFTMFGAASRHIPSQPRECLAVMPDGTYCKKALRADAAGLSNE